MFSIAVCDDDIKLCSFFEKALEQELSKKRIELETFYSGETLIKSLENGTHFDLVFLDIELEGLNGIDVAKKIRGEMDNQTTQIIYISAKTSYAMELFETRPMNFLVKPFHSKDILENVSNAEKLWSDYQSCFEYKNKNGIERIPFGEIIYFESNNRTVIVHTKAGKFEFYGKLSEIEGITPVDFVRIHQSYLINKLFVRRWKREEVFLGESIVLPISKAYRKSVCSVLIKGEGR